MDIINEKFSIDSTSFEIVDSENGWTIKKEKGKPPTMTQFLFKCTAKDEEGQTCYELFAENAKLEEHEKEARYGHRFILDWTL